jgi:hypothetical protein
LNFDEGAYYSVTVSAHGDSNSTYGGGKHKPDISITLKKEKECDDKQQK